MKYGWNVNEVTFGELSRDFFYTNLLVDNIMAENLPEVTNLLETKKANPNTVVPELGVAPLHLLAGLENEEFTCKITLQAILKNGGNPNVRSEEGLTPVHVAAMWGRCKVLEILLAYGGDPDLIDNKLYKTAEEYAVDENQWDAFGVLNTFSIMVDGYDTNKYLEAKLFEVDEKFTTPDDKAVVKLKDKSTNCSDTENSGANSYRYSVIKKERKSKNKSLSDYDSCSHDRKRGKANDMIERVRDVINSARSHYSMGKDKNYKRKNNQVNDYYNNEIASIQNLKLNEKAVNAIRRQRKKTNVYESLEDIRKEVSDKNVHSDSLDKYSRSYYGDSVSENYDWIRKSGNSVKLDNKALNTIRAQRLSSKIYQTKGLGEDPLEDREKEPPIYEECETYDWIDPRYREEFDEPSIKKIHSQKSRTTTYKSEDLGGLQELSSAPELPKRNRKKHLKKSRGTGSEIYLYGYAEQSISGTSEHQNQPKYNSSHSNFNCSEISERRFPSDRSLCKMSRMFLFMLKKRHIYHKLK